MTTVELPRGIALNRFRVRCPGLHLVTRLPAPRCREERTELETALGQSVFVTGVYACLLGDVDVDGGDTVELPCGQNRAVHRFDLRQGLVSRAHAIGLDASTAFAQELTLQGFPGETVVDGIRVQRRLAVRFVDVIEDASTFLVARSRTRWLVEGTLANVEQAQHAEGEVAERLAGHGPRRGVVVKALDSELILAAADEEHSVSPQDYTLTASYSYVSRYCGADTLRRLQVESGSLTASGHRNKYAVKDRYQACIDELSALGWAFDIASSEQVVIEPAWTEVRIQSCR